MKDVSLSYVYKLMLSMSFKAIAVLVLICFELMIIYQLFNLYSTYSVW